MYQSGEQSGRRLQKVVLKLGIDSFMASYGWLDRFKRCHGFTYKNIHRENASVGKEIAEYFLRHLDGYKPKDIFNADKTDIFTHIPQKDTFCQSRPTPQREEQREDHCSTVCKLR
jgi:hypothetical protein